MRGSWSPLFLSSSSMFFGSLLPVFLCWFFFPISLRCLSSEVFIGDFLAPQPTSLLLIITAWKLVFCTNSEVRFGPYLPGIIIFIKIGIDLCVLVGLGCWHFNFPSLLCRRTFSSRGRRRITVHVETMSSWSGNDHFRFGPWSFEILHSNPWSFNFNF